jgi:hypothetical protein
VTATTETDQLISPLAAFARLPEWLADAIRPHRVAESLTRHVPELADGRVALLECTPQRLRAKSGAWLARYRLRVTGRAGTPWELVLVGSLCPPGEPLPDQAGVGTAPAAFGERGWGCVLPDLRLELHVEESDEALPALGTLVRPTRVARLLEPVLHEAGYDGARITTCDPVVVRYKPGSRCTVVVGLRYAGGAGPDPVVVKTHQGDKGETAWAAMTALWQKPEGWRDAVRLAEPLGYLREDRVLVQGPVPEELTLKDLARAAVVAGRPADLDRLRRELSKTAHALAAVHRSGVAYARTATLEDELLEVESVVQRLSLCVPQLAPAARPLLRALADGAAHAPPDGAVPAHHDFRPAQVLLHRGGVGFIDFDGACMAEPALDLGRFRAKLRDIGVSSLTGDEEPARPTQVADMLRLLDDLCEHFLSAYLRHAKVSRHRVVLWETCDLLTGLLHAWTKVRLARVEPRLSLLVHQLRSQSALLGTG